MSYTLINNDKIETFYLVEYKNTAIHWGGWHELQFKHGNICQFSTEHQAVKCIKEVSRYSHTELVYRIVKVTNELVEYDLDDEDDE